MTFRSLAVALSAALLGVACADTIGPNDPDAGSADAGPPMIGELPRTSGRFTHSVTSGVVTTVVDASDEAVWRHLDMDTGRSVQAASGWELAFSRFRVRVNGGVSGAGGVQVAELEGVAFDALTRAPEEGWTVPVADGEVDDDAEPDNAFNDGESDWYEYELETHTLTARDVTYVIASTAGAFFKLSFESYYDDAGSPGIVRFRWAPIEAPTSALPDAGPGGAVDGGADLDAGVTALPEHAIIVDASDPEAWIYVSATGGVVDVVAPATDASWDLALRRTQIQTNSGTSGAGLGGAREDPSGEAFDDVAAASTLGFVADATIDTGVPGAEPTSVSAPLAGWYDYDPTTHTVSPGDRTYLVRTGVGGYAKLRVWSWADGTYALSLVPIERAVEVRVLDVDASIADAWTYLSLRDGAIVEVLDPATDGSWDVGISGTRLRTNGGTSGAGQGAAVETAATSIASLGEPPADGWTEDEMMSEGPPGSPAYSGNPVLASWYDYDPARHSVTPRPVVFAVRTADGHPAALRVIGYEGGVHQVELAFAGPHATSFGGGE